MNYRSCQNIFVLTLLLLLTACSSNSIYRSDYKTCNYNASGDCSKNALQIHAPDKKDEYRLGFVEFDDQGQLRDREQMNAVLTECAIDNLCAWLASQCEARR